MMEKTSLSLKQDSRFIRKLLVVEAIAFCPFIRDMFEGRVVVLWSHHGVRPWFFGALALYATGIVLALLIKNRTVALVVAAIFALPFFALPFLEIAIITSMSGF